MIQPEPTAINCDYSILGHFFSANIMLVLIDLKLEVEGWEGLWERGRKGFSRKINCFSDHIRSLISSLSSLAGRLNILIKISIRLDMMFFLI